MEIMYNDKVVKRSLADYYSNNRSKIKSMLRKRGVTTTDDKSTIAAFADQAQRSEEFRREVASDMVRSSYTSLTGFRNTDGGALEGATLGGADPVSAVANAIGSIFGMIGASQNRKGAKEQAEHEMFMKVTGNKKSSNTNKLIIGGIIVACIALVGIIIIANKKKK
jgi:hypothetical protein